MCVQGQGLRGARLSAHPLVVQVQSMQQHLPCSQISKLPRPSEVVGFYFLYISWSRICPNRGDIQAALSVPQTLFAARGEVSRCKLCSKGNSDSSLCPISRGEEAT